MEQNEKDELVSKMITDQNLRKEIVSKSHSWFFYFYFPHYIEYKIAPFQEQMFALTEDTKIKNAVVVAFRNSGKSSIFTLSLPIWAILGQQQIKHVLILSSTQQKAQQLLQHIKKELETNRILQGDLGPFKEEKNEWNMSSLYIPKYNAKINTASVEQSIRSIRFKQYRPELIIIDDMEDLESVKTKESRDKIDNWLMGEVIPAGDTKTRLMVVGNLLHNDSVIKRLEKKIEEKKMTGVYFKFPIIDENNNPAWPGKYPNLEAVMAEKLKGLSEIAWNREYLLKIVPEEDQIIKEEYINYYDALPFPLSSRDYRGAMTSVDLAISQAESADFTAVLSAYIHGYGKERKIYLIPNPVNKKMSSIESANCVSSISRSLGNGISTRVIVEDVGYQRAFIDLLKEREIPAEGVPIAGHDKTSRLMTTAPLIQQGQILFPKKGCELLITQLIGFGVEKHDDLMDALTLLVLKLMRDDGNSGRIIIPGPYNLIQSPYDPDLDAIEKQDIERGMDPKLAKFKKINTQSKIDFAKSPEKQEESRRFNAEMNIVKRYGRQTINI